MKRSDLRILVVDDNDSTRSMVVAFLTSSGFFPYEVRDGATAVHLMQNTVLDLIITDLLMPGGGGMQVVMSAKNLIPRPKVIVISGAISSQDFFSEAREMGADAVFPKPISLQTLISKIDELLGCTPA